MRTWGGCRRAANLLTLSYPWFAAKLLNLTGFPRLKSPLTPTPLNPWATRSPREWPLFLLAASLLRQYCTISELVDLQMAIAVLILTPRPPDTWMSLCWRGSADAAAGRRCLRHCKTKALAKA